LLAIALALAFAFAFARSFASAFASLLAQMDGRQRSSIQLSSVNSPPPKKGNLLMVVSMKAGQLLFKSSQISMKRLPIAKK